jgi:PAS domain S-box-containing protein
MSLEEALLDGSELLEVLFERAPLAVAVLDRDLVLRKVNQAFVDSVAKHGAPEAGPVQIGRSLHDYFPDTVEQTIALMDPVLAGETVWHRGVPHDHQGQLSYWDLLHVPLRRHDAVVGVVQLFTDATERTEAQHDLARSERRVRSILRNSADIVVLIDAAGVPRYIAPSAGSQLKLAPRRSRGNTDVTALAHPDDVARVRELLAQVAAKPGDSPVFRCRLRHRDDTWHTFEVAPVNLLEDPDVEGIVLTARDVTDREQAEDELRRSDAILEAVRFAAQRFLESQSSWRASINEVMAQLGHAAAVSRVYIFENFQDEDGARWTSQSHEWVAPGVTSQIDNPALTAMCYETTGFAPAAHALADGEVVAGAVSSLPESEQELLAAQDIASIALVPVFADGKWWGFIGFDDCERERSWSASEIGALRAAASTLGAAIQRQRAEDQLREQQARYRQVFEATGDGLVITDLDGRLVRANPAFHQMHGYQPDELTGRPVTAWTHPDFHEALGRCTAAVLGGEQPRSPAVDVRKDGSTFPVQVQGSAFTFQGQPHILSVVRDDTERTQAFGLLEKRVAALSTIAASLRVNQALTDTLEVIVRAVVGATPAVACSASVIDPATDELRIYATVGLPPGYAKAVEQCWRLDRRTTEQLCFSTEPLIIRDVVRQALETPSMAPLHALLPGVPWDCVVILPMETQNRKFGSVNAFYPRELRPSDDDSAFLRAVADQGAVAVENSRLLAEAQNRAGLEERQRLARELHDSVSQALYGIALGARTAAALAKDGPEQLAEPLEYVLALADAGMAEMRSLIFELRPESLATEGLVAALQKRVAVLRSRHQLRVTAELGSEPELPLALKETLYRIAQEALHNTVKHAHAEHVTVRLTRAEAEVELEVADDGIGFDVAESHPGHLGLKSMTERTAAHRGRIELDSRAGAGTTIRIRLPVPS